MNKLSKAILLSLVALLLASMPVLAAVAYRAAYTIVESDGNAYDMLATLEVADNEWMADNGFMQPDALDTRIETFGGLIRPHMVAQNKTLTSVAVPANSQTNLYFTTANSDLSSLDIIIGNDGYVTIPDDDTLDGGAGGTNDFEIEQLGYVDTDATTVSFQAAGVVSEAANGNVTPALPVGWTQGDIWLCLVASLDNVNSTMPAGWTTIDAGTINGANLQTALFWRRAEFGDAAPLVTHAAGNGISAVIVGYSGVTPDGSPFDVTQAVYVKTPASIVNNFGAGMTTSISNDTIVLLSGVGGQTTSITYTGTPTPAERVDAPDTAARPSLVIADFPLVTAGATGARTSTITSFLNNGYQLSLIPIQKNLVHKQHAYRTYIDGATNITSEILEFPEVAAENGGQNNVAGLNHTVNLPANIRAGNLLLVFFCSDADPGIGWPGGWTELFDDDQGAVVAFAAAYRVADGTEGATIVVTTGNAQQTAHTSYRITGYSGVPEVGTSATGIGVNPDPPSLTPSWGLENTLWFASCGYEDDADALTAYPTDYTDGRNDKTAGIGTAGASVGSARRELSAVTEDPGTFTFAVGDDWVANTVAIAPADIEVTATGIASGEYTVTTSLNANQYDFSDYGTYTSVAVNMGAGLIPVILLEEQELTVAAASVTFSGIDTLVAEWDTYGGVTSRHLVLVVNAASPDAVALRGIRIQINGDNGNNYNLQQLRGAIAVASATIDTSAAIIAYSIPADGGYPDAFGGGVTLFPHAFNAINHKSALSLGGAVEEDIAVSSHRWANSNPITSMLIYSNVGNLVAGSTFWLGVVDERYLVEEDLLAADGLINFAGIPQDGSDLVVIGYPRTDRAATSDIITHQINADAVGANYNRQYIRGIAGVSSAASVADMWVGTVVGDTGTANAFGGFVATYFQYNEGLNFPSYLALSGHHETTALDAAVYILSGRRSNVAAITQLDYIPLVGANFKAGTLFSLYRVPRTVIDRQELTAPAATITFTNIPQGYEALQLNIYARTDTVGVTDDVDISFNNDVVAANYNWQELTGDGAVVAATRNAASTVFMTVVGNGAGGNIYGAGTATIPNYAKADRHKHYYSINGAAEDIVRIESYRWEDLAPITEIDLTPNVGANFLAGTIVELVGIFPQDVFSIEVDGDLYGIADGNNASVSANGNDWLLNQNNVMPYMDYYYHTVGGVLHAWYQPNYMVESTDSGGTETAGGSAVLITAAEITEGVDYWVGGLVTITAAAGAAPEGEARVCTASAVGSITVAPAFSANVDIGDTFTVDFGTLIDRSYYGLDFDAVDDIVVCGADASMDITNTATLIAWVYIDSDGENNEGSIIDRRDATPDGYRLYVSNEAAGDVAIEAILDGATDAYAISNVEVSISGWHYIVAVYNRLGTFHWEIYEDSVLLGLTTDQAGVAPITGHTANVMNIGDNVASNRCFDGRIDEPSFYSRAFAQAEVTSNYNTGSGLYTPSSSTDIELQLHIEEGSAAATADTSGNGNNGTITNAVWINGFVPRPAGNGGTNDSRLTWGVNPTGVAVTLGGMVSAGQPIPGALPSEPAQDILLETPVTDWYEEPDVAGALLTNPLRPFVTMWSDNTNLNEIQCWRLYALALILLVTVATALSVGRHQGITAIMASVAILGSVVMTIFPMWTLVFAIGMFIGGLVMERSPSF